MSDSVTTRALFLSSAPLQPDGEGRGTKAAEAALIQAILEAQAPPRLALRAVHGVTTDDLIGLLLEERPALLHFSDAADESGLRLRDREGRPASVSGAALAELLLAIPEIRCVVLGGSGTAPLAAALLGQSDSREAVAALAIAGVIAVEGSIEEETRSAFSQGLYTALAAGESLKSAARLARVQALLMNRADAQRLVLVQRTDDDGALVLCPPPA